MSFQHIERKLELILTALHRVLSNQETFMANAAELTTALTDCTAAVNALEAKISGTPASVPEAELDPILSGLKALTASIDAIVNPPTPPAAA